MALILDILAASAAAVSALIIVLVWARYRGHSVSYIRGPKGGEWLVGHEYILFHQRNSADNELKWFNEFGNVVRTKNSFNRDMLFVADPKLIQHVFANTYKFPKPNDTLTALESLFGGKGLISSTGSMHAWQRKMMLPAYNAGQLRQFMTVFHDVADKLKGKWNDMTETEGTVINIHEWLSRATLEVMGDSSFNYKFNSVQGEYKSTELGEAVSGLFTDSGAPTRISIMYNALIRISPDPIVRLLKLLPNKQNDRFKKYFRLSDRVLNRIMETRKTMEDKEKDVLSVLMQHNETAQRKLTGTELTAQLTLTILAGHDTTAATLTWLFWELAKDQKTQSRIRAEVREARKRVGNGKDLSQADYDGMTYLNAALKEALRFHPIASSLIRRVTEDDVLPLSEPLMTDKGMVTGIPVSKGQDLQLSFACYHRLKSVWGEDADKWNVERWVNKDWSKTINVGMTSNLMAFSGGVQGCLGWKFAYMESQVMTAQLFEAFEFSEPEGGLDVIRIPVIVMSPVIATEPHKGVQMPLVVKPITYDD